MSSPGLTTDIFGNLNSGNAALRAYANQQLAQNVGQEQADNQAAAAKDAADRAAPDIDPRFEQLQKQMGSLATDFRNNIPQIAQGLMTNLADQSRRNLADTIDQTRQNYNSRGLLYSNARLGAESNARGQAASDLAQKRYQVNQELSSDADQLDQNAINTGLAIAGEKSGVASQNAQFQGDLANAILKQQQNQADAFKGLGQGIGSAAGTLAGLLPSITQTTTPGAGLSPSTVGRQSYLPARPY